jgi:nitronate monooxygenase
MTGDFEKMALYAGTGADAVNAIVPAGERVHAIIAEAEEILTSETEHEFASPVCYARESDDVYSGYASREDLIAFCNLLLEAERAGARITARTALEFHDEHMRQLLRAIHRDEAACCAMLLKWIGALSGEVSPRTGDFYEKCLAIPDVSERVAFINRGQGWVVRKLREMVPKIRDDAMHADLSAMLKTHEINIARANQELDGAKKDG